MKKIILVLAIMIPVITFSQTRFITRSGQAKIFSHTVAEDITALNNGVTSTIDTETGEIIFSIPVQSFEFEKALMQKHFNTENFMNSEIFPKITFKGRINENLKWGENGKYEVTVTGEITIRDVTKSITEKGTIEVNNGTITATSVFLVKQIGSYNVGKPTSKSKVNNVSDDIEVTYKGIYTK